MPDELNDHARDGSQCGENATARPNHVLPDAATPTNDYLVTRIHFDRGGAGFRPRDIEYR